MKNKILVYDDKCPLCTAYSSWFIKTGMLAPGSRKAFSTLEPELLDKMDFSRGRNEIPLLDTETGETRYGIDALLLILGNKCQLIEKLGRLRIIYWLLKKFYKLVSFNRKVIVASKCGPGNIDCSPDFNYQYRFLFMLSSLLFNTLMLFPIYHIALKPMPGFHLTIIELQAAHFLMVAVNLTLASRLNRERAFEYLGQVNMLALISILLMIPLLILPTLLKPGVIIVSIYLTIIAIIVFREYLRRMEYAGIIPAEKWVASTNFVSIMGFVLFVFA